MFVQGGVYRYSYLWAREHDTGEESGRKERPVCLIFKSARGQLFVVPITTRQPTADQIHREAPARDLRLAGLSERSWVILDEFNSAFERQSYDFTSVEPIGSFSEPFLDELVETLLDLIRKRRAREVRRS